MPTGQLRGQETINGMQCCRSQNQRPQSESPHEAQIPYPPTRQTTRWEMEHEEPELNLQVRPLSPSEAGEQCVCVCVCVCLLGGGGEVLGGGGQLAWESNSWSSSETLGKSLPPWWPTSLRHKNGWLENLVGPLQLSPGSSAATPSSSPKDSNASLGPGPGPLPAPSHPPTKHTRQATGELNLCPDGTERGPYRTLAGSPHRATEEGETGDGVMSIPLTMTTL